MKYLRTPDECFENLQDYPFQPHYQMIADGEGGELRIHCVDEGSGEAGTVLLMHGQPTWSYLYRHMIPPLVNAGFRVVAPDLVGFGRSDKPASLDDYSYARHIAWMSEWLGSLDLQNIMLFCQDWGGLIGLRLVAAFPERFAGVVASNTGLPTGMVPAEYCEPLREAYKTLRVGKVTELDEKFRDDSEIPGFLYWRKFCAESPEFDVGQALQLTAKGQMSEAVAAGYRAPFPDQSYMAGARKFPSLVPLLPDEDEVQENLEAWKVLRQFNKPFITAFADDDPASTGGEASFLESVPGADGAPHRTIENAGHLVQQDQPQACVQAILDLAALGAPTGPSSA
jgi:haloalkane dehalogenase